MTAASNIVELPDRPARSWPTVAEGLTEHLIEMVRDPAAVPDVVEPLRSEYISAWEGPSLPADPDDAVAMINAWATGFMFLLLQIAAEARLELRSAAEK